MEAFPYCPYTTVIFWYAMSYLLLDFSTRMKFIEDKVFVPLIQYYISSICNLLHDTASNNSVNKLMTAGLQS